MFKIFVLFSVTDRIPCGFPGQPLNGSSITKKAVSGPGDSVIYSCDRNFTMTGSHERVCLSSGIWAGTQPLCRK